MIQQDEKLCVSESMRKYGGGFVHALGAALMMADMQNTAKIKSAWPEYWEEYKKLSTLEVKDGELPDTGGTTGEAKHKPADV